MKSLFASLLLLALLALPEETSAQLLPDQRTFDFQNLVALYAKRYAPYDWKRRALGFDLFDIQPWLDRVRAAKNDLEFFEIEAEYVGNLNDTHSGFFMTSSFRANLGITVDIYDGKVLIDSINRSTLPATNYPFQIGDELVSVDSVSVEDWINRISVWRRYGNPVSTRRLAAAQITFRNQTTFPRAVEIGDSAVVTIRRANGNLEDYTILWRKTGLPVFSVGPVPLPQAPAPLRMTASTRESGYLPGVDELHQYKLPESDVILTRIPWVTDENGVARTYVNGVGSIVPVFRAGFPTNFIQRLGRLPSEFHYSGTYLADGLTLGYLRIPNFAPPNLSDAVREIQEEIRYLQDNTDGLVIDVTRNSGGGCYMLDAAATLIPYPFYFFGEEIRATQDRLNALQAQLENAQSTGAEQWVIDTYRSYVDQLKAALATNRGMTAPIAACRQFGSTGAPITFGNQPAPAVYTKPIIVLIDEFSISAGEIFPAMIQDNARALLVGARTSGGGGSVSGWPTGFYSESISNNTNSLVVRKSAIKTAEYPAAPYVENIGARPDIPLDFMTTENLLTGGRTYVNQFTQILLHAIRTTISAQLESQSLSKKSN
jgi:C-terminal processing protease CtpA/Prc